MPHYRSPFEKGNFIIKFDVQFPETGFTSTDRLRVSVCQGLDRRVCGLLLQSCTGLGCASLLGKETSVSF